MDINRLRELSGVKQLNEDYNEYNVVELDGKTVGELIKFLQQFDDSGVVNFDIEQTSNYSSPYCTISILTSNY